MKNYSKMNTINNNNNNNERKISKNKPEMKEENGNCVKFSKMPKRRKRRISDIQVREVIRNSLTDPHETPLKWWESEPIKYA